MKSEIEQARQESDDALAELERLVADLEDHYEEHATAEGA